MGFYHDVPKPNCWPPPDNATDAKALFMYAKSRDPKGDLTHCIFASVFLFCLPLDSAPASISLAILSIFSFIRLKFTWRTYALFCRSKIVFALFTWSIWMTISILWSTDKDMGFDHASSLWIMAIPTFLLIWPIIERWTPLLVSFLLGVALQNCLQLSEVLFAFMNHGIDWITGKEIYRPSGLANHPGNASIYFAIATIILLAVTFTKMRFKLHICMALGLSVFGLVAAQSRAVGLGFACGLIYMCLDLLLKKTGISMKHISIVIAAITVLVTVTAMSNPSVVTRVAEIPRSIEKFSEGKITGGIARRMYWWSNLTKKSFEKPAMKNLIAGHGLGSTRAVHFGNNKLSKSINNPSHPHSLIVQLLYETGLIGLGLFIILIGIVLKTINEHKEHLIACIACKACLVTWLVTAIFDGGQNSGRVLALLMLVVLFAVSRQILSIPTKNASAST